MYVKSIDHSVHPGHLLEDVRTRLNDIACEKMQAICADNWHRLENCKTDPQLLSKGIFYPHEYYEALKETNQTAQIETLKKTDSFYHGLVSSEHFRIDTSLAR